MTGSVASAQLRAFIERIERLEEEKKTIADDIKDVYGEAKGTGFDTKILRKVIQIRKQDRDERAEQEAILDSYLAALGMIAQPDFFDEEPRQSVPASREERRRQLMSEDMAVHKNLVDEMADAGLISEEARHENKALADAVATKFGNGPAMALRSDAGLNIVTKHTEITASPVDAAVTTGDGLREPVAAEQDQIIREGDAPRETDRLGGDASCPDTQFQMDRATEGSFETGSEAAEKGREAIPAGPEGADLNHAGAGESPATEKATVATQGEATEPTSDDGAKNSAAANAGGNDVDGSAPRAEQEPTSKTGEGAASALPTKPKFHLRPNCLDRSNCKSGSVDHCWSCKKAMAEKSEVAA